MCLIFIEVVTRRYLQHLYVANFRLIRPMLQSWIGIWEYLSTPTIIHARTVQTNLARIYLQEVINSRPGLDFTWPTCAISLLISEVKHISSYNLFSQETWIWWNTYVSSYVGSKTWVCLTRDILEICLFHICMDKEWNHNYPQYNWSPGGIGPSALDALLVWKLLIKVSST